jgi:signal transduction histidine kinase
MGRVTTKTADITAQLASQITTDLVHEEEIRERLLELKHLKANERFRRKEAEALVEGLTQITNAKSIKAVFSATINTLRSFIPIDCACILEYNQDESFNSVVSDPPDMFSQSIAANPAFTRALDSGFVNLCNLSIAPGCEVLQGDGRDQSAVLFKLESHHFTGLLYLGNIHVGAFSQKHLTSLINFTPLMNQTIQQILYVEDLEEKVHLRTLALEQALQNTELLANERARQLTDNEILTSLGRTVQGIAHEFNTPIGICITSSSYIKQVHGAISQDLQNGSISKLTLSNYLTDVDSSVNLLMRNLNKVADYINNFKEIVVDQEFNDVRHFNLADYINSTVNTQKHLFEQTNIALKLQLDKTIELTTSPNALLQVISHLLTNVLSHAFTAEALLLQSPQLVISLRDGSEFVTLVFEDNGKGIKAAQLSHIYEPFFTTSRFKGKHIGLGLHIVYKVVTDKLYGTISCEAVEGEYCRFLIKMPKNDKVIFDLASL